MKIDINANLDYIAGYLRYGHLEGTIDIPEEDIEKFKENKVELGLRFFILFQTESIVL